MSKIQFNWFCKDTWNQSAKNTLWCLIGSIIGKTIPNNQYLTRLMIILTVIIVILAVSL